MIIIILLQHIHACYIIIIYLTGGYRLLQFEYIGKTIKSLEANINVLNNAHKLLLQSMAAMFNCVIATCSNVDEHTCDSYNNNIMPHATDDHTT